MHDTTLVNIPSQVGKTAHSYQRLQNASLLGTARNEITLGTPWNLLAIMNTDTQESEDFESRWPQDGDRLFVELSWVMMRMSFVTQRNASTACPRATNVQATFSSTKPQLTWLIAPM